MSHFPTGEVALAMALAVCAPLGGCAGSAPSVRFDTRVQELGPLVPCPLEPRGTAAPSNHVALVVESDRALRGVFVQARGRHADGILLGQATANPADLVKPGAHRLALDLRGPLNTTLLARGESSRIVFLFHIESDAKTWDSSLDCSVAREP
jgi:hypothetical protein